MSRGGAWPLRAAATQSCEVAARVTSPSAIRAAMAGGVTLGALAGVIHPYPTLAEVLRKAGDAWNRRRLTPLTRRLLAGWLNVRFGRCGELARRRGGTG